VSKCTEDTENTYAPLVMVLIGAQKRTLASHTVYKNGSTETSFDKTMFSLDSTLKEGKNIQSFPFTELGYLAIHV
jgi:hypothetical protein